MIGRHLIPVLLIAGLVSACGTGPRVHDIRVPAGGPQNAQDMVNNWDSNKKTESRCSWEQAGQQIGVDGKPKTKTVTPACGDYKK